MYVLTICKYIRILSKIFSGSPSKDNKTFFIKVLGCHIASYTPFNLLPLEINSCLAFTVDETHHEPVITSFSKQLLLLFSYVGGALVTN